MFKKKLSKFRRKTFEALGSDRYSRPSLYEMDRKLEKYLTHREGFFVEAGANNGFSQSNTYYFEQLRDWTGILVEGIPELYEQCVVERPKSKVFNCALVDNEFTDSHITMKYANLMSIVEGAMKSKDADKNHIERGQKAQQNLATYEVQVPARTLTSILDECKVEKIDLFSLDVEGFELNVLKGLDLDKYRPNYLLIEARFKEEIDEYISDLYIQVDRFSIHDFLYQRRDI